MSQLRLRQVSAPMRDCKAVIHDGEDDDAALARSALSSSSPSSFDLLVLDLLDLRAAPSPPAPPRHRLRPPGGKRRQQRRQKLLFLAPRPGRLPFFFFIGCNAPGPAACGGQADSPPRPHDRGPRRLPLGRRFVPSEGSGQPRGTQRRRRVIGGGGARGGPGCEAFLFFFFLFELLSFLFLFELFFSFFSFDRRLEGLPAGRGRRGKKQPPGALRRARRSWRKR